MYIVICYAAYLAISVSVTIGVGRTLYRSGRTFLVEAFHGNTELADSVNRLLIVGFYLINVGYVARELRTYGEIATARAAIELVSDKVGLVLLALGVIHIGNVYALNRLRKRAHADLRPPFPPDARIPVMGQ